MLILYFSALPEEFIRPNNFLVEALGSLKYSTISSVNVYNLTSSFPFLHFFFLPHCLKTSGSILNKSGEMTPMSHSRF